MDLSSPHTMPFVYEIKGDNMKITAITPQKRNKNFYNIHIDYEYYCSVDDETIYHMKLKEDMEVDAELLMKASIEGSYKKALNYSLNMLAKSYKTKSEIVKKLKDKEYNENTIKAVLEKLEEYGYLNDKQYVDAFIRSKQDTSQGLNKRTLYNKLLQKGVDKELIQESLEHSEIDEYQNALLSAQKKLRSLKGNTRDKKAKLYSFLLYKGFQYEICNKVLENIEITE
jgi:regulatory protein